MKILVGSLSRHFGGVESLFLNIVRCNKKAHFDMDFVCTDSRAAREDDFLAEGSDVIHIARPSGNLSSYTKAFFKILKEGGYNIYHVNLTRFRFPLDVMIARMAGVKVILHCHSTQIYASRKPAVQMVRRIEQELFRPVMLKCSSMNIACSRNAGEYLFGRHPYSVIHNGINLSAFYFNSESRDRMRDLLGVKSKTVLGHIGRFSSEKNHKFLLDLAEALKKIDPSYILLCIGEGDLFNEIEEEIRKRGLGENVILTGERTDVSELLNAMDIFVFPSLHEALPVTLIEAQANGLPCVISDYITDEIDVMDLKRLPVSQGTAEWVDAITHTQIQRYDINQYQDKLKEFDINEMVENLERVYSEIM